MEQYRTLKYPPVVFWEVTDQCNHNCIHCFNYWRTDKEKLTVCQPKTAEDYLTIARKVLLQKPARVVFTGGEPLIAFEQLKPTLALFRKHHVNISFNTNAALLTEEIARFFAENRIGMFISFPSCNADEFDTIVDRQGAFERVGNALKLAKTYHLFYAFNMVVSRINLSSVYNTAAYLKTHFDIKRISITRVSIPINAIHQFEQYFLSASELENYMQQCVRIKRELGIDVTAASPITPCSVSSQDSYDLFALANSCEAGKTSFVIGSTGNLRACARDSEEYGNILEEPFETIWARMSSWRDDSFIPSECAECAVKSHCRGGCRVDGIVKHGTRNCLDHYSDVSRLPLRFTKHPGYAMPWDYTTEFIVPDGIQAVEEDFAVRLSYRGGYAYCTQAFSDYLLQTKEFSLDEFCEHFDQPPDVATSVLQHLYKNGIIQTK